MQQEHETEVKDRHGEALLGPVMPLLLWAMVYFILCCESHFHDLHIFHATCSGIK